MVWHAVAAPASKFGGGGGDKGRRENFKGIKKWKKMVEITQKSYFFAIFMLNSSHLV